ncbi:MAG: beta-lactamase family protein [Thermomicrobiales bacterium]|nr:beta-lactamase family protein [Thermomicrobiales bacterium]
MTTATQRIETALQQIDGWIGPEAVKGASAAVWHAGELVAVRHAGEARDGVPVDDTTLFGLASVTKPVTAATVVSLVDTGELDLDMPVVAVLPEFGEISREPFDRFRSDITIRQLLSHTSGLPEDLSRGSMRSIDQPSLDQLTDAMLDLPLEYEPATALLYSNAGFAALARIAEVVTGDDFWELTWQRVFEPLQLRNTIDHPGPGLDERIAELQDAANKGKPTEAYNSRYWKDLAIPWGGLYGSATDLVTFAAAFLRPKDTIITRPLMEEMIRDQAHGVPGAVQSLRVHWPVASWGLGWEVKGEKRKHWSGNLTSPSTFCHFGAAGTLLWADPDHDVALAVFANRTTYHLWPFVPPRWAMLSDALIEAVR